MPVTDEGAIVAGVDGSGSAVRAAVWAATEAYKRRLPLRLVHVYTVPCAGLPTITGSLEHVRDGMAERGRGWLEEAEAAVLQEHPGLTIDVAAREWNPIVALIQESQRARMVVLGSHGHGGFTGLLVGSTAVSLVTHGHCPVMVVRGRLPEDPPPTEGPVIVGADGSPHSDAAVAFACEEASLRGTGVTAVHTWSEVFADGTLRQNPLAVDPVAVDHEESGVLAEQLARWQEKYPDLAISRVVVRGRPVRTLLEYGERAQLIVVGSRGRGGFKGMLLGFTSQALVAHSPCPVAVVRPQAGEMR